VWRPLSDPVEDFPLAFCDTATVSPEDCVAVDLVKRDDYEGESMFLRHNPDHQFYYLSQQRPHEVSLLLMTESDPASSPRFKQGEEEITGLIHLNPDTWECQPPHFGGKLSQLADLQFPIGLPHAAFSLPVTDGYPAPPPRESIEVRTLVIV